MTEALYERYKDALRRGHVAAQRGRLEEALDAYGEAEQATGWHCMIDENLELPFETEILGVTARVEKIDVADDDAIVAVCRRGSHRQTVPLLDLPMPSPAPRGSEWVEAYRRWKR